MAEIAPFAGIHFDPARVVLADVIAPPYDVLSPEQRDALYARDPHNIVRLILNREEPDDDSANRRYTRAAAFLRENLANGTLVQDSAPALYEYLQRFEHPLDPQRLVERRTLFVALKLEPYARGVVLPHEETHPKAKADRLELMRATHANPEPIYGLYEDPQGTVAQRLDAARGGAEPFLQAVYPGRSHPDGEQHLVYRHTDASLLSALEELFAPRRVWIADGHHRYETALNYQAGDGGQGTGAGGQRAGVRGHGTENPTPVRSGKALEPRDYILIGLSAFEDPGLVVLPTHRLIRNLSPSRLEELPLQLERFFQLRVLPVADARAWIQAQVPGEKRFAILRADRAYALTPRDESQLLAAMDSSHCPAWRALDVSLLQTFVLDRSLGISWATLAHTPDVAYTRDEEEAVQKVASGDFQLACLLQNPTVTEVRDVAAAGDRMPQKSTFFYPKLWSGLILRSLE